MKLALQGHTILLASGDYGVAMYPGDVTPSGCLSDPAYGENQTIYNPDLTSSCPYINQSEQHSYTRIRLYSILKV